MNNPSYLEEKHTLILAELIKEEKHAAIIFYRLISRHYDDLNLNPEDITDSHNLLHQLRSYLLHLAQIKIIPTQKLTPEIIDSQVLEFHTHAFKRLIIDTIAFNSNSKTHSSQDKF